MVCCWAWLLGKARTNFWYSPPSVNLVHVKQGWYVHALSVSAGEKTLSKYLPVSSSVILQFVYLIQNVVTWPAKYFSEMQKSIISCSSMHRLSRLLPAQVHFSAGGLREEETIPSFSQSSCKVGLVQAALKSRCCTWARVSWINCQVSAIRNVCSSLIYLKVFLFSGRAHAKYKYVSFSFRIL